MKRLIPKLIAGLLLAGALALPADAATAYMLNWHNFSPYAVEAVAGPFNTIEECNAVKNQQTFQSGGFYSCDSFYY